MHPLAPSGKLLEEVQAFAENFAGERLDTYTNALKSTKALANTPKEINDAIWGTIRLEPLEVILLDSPLVQRLRFIRQLGVVHWIYPGAVHTRFEHSLGVLFRVQQLIIAINAASPKTHSQAIDPDQAAVLRLCAILHDIGHGAFSHVSEHALARNDIVRTLLNHFAVEHRLSKVQLSEVMAYFIIGSKSFLSFLETSLSRVEHPVTIIPGIQNASSIINLLQRAIIGESIDDRVPLLHELISGPFDADKLDYFVRDARLTGIPAVLDISRLTQKIGVQVVSARDLPEKIGRNVSGKLHDYYLFGLKWSGASVLDELHLARVLLYTKIYRHPKVLAAEAMVEALLDALAMEEGVEPIQLIQTIYLYVDDQLLWSDAQSLLKAIGLSRPNELTVLLVSDLLQRLRDRRLFMNALSVRANYPGDPWFNDNIQSAGLKLLVERLSNPQGAREFRAELAKEMNKIADLSPKSVMDGFPSKLIAGCVVISAKDRLPGGTSIDRAFIFQGNKIVTYRDLSGVNHAAWADAYTFSASAANVFCPRELTGLCYVAAEKIIRLKFNVVLPQATIELSKQDPERITQLKRDLENAGYYEGIPFDIRPVPTRMGQADVDGFLNRIAAKLEAFDEPSAPVGARRAATIRARVENWLSQFRTNGEVDCAMTLLDRLRVLGRNDTRDGLRQFAVAHPEFVGATIVLLGDLKDSGAVQSYLSMDVDDIFPRVMTVEDAASKNDAPIVFVDDFLCSGGQLRDMLGNWFDIDAMKSDSLREQRELFGEKEREYVRGRKVGFMFVAGWDSGKDSLRQSCQEAKIDATVFSHLSEGDIPFAFENCLDTHDQADIEAFKIKCREIGISLVEPECQNEAKAKSRALGYGNRGMLLVSRYNVPTGVLTCLWKSGHVDGTEWQGLLMRRGKK